MVPKTQSAKTPIAGPPTTVVRKPLAGIPPFGCPSVAAAPPRHPRGLSMAPVCPTKTPSFRSWTYANETNETHCRYEQCVFSYDECPICTPSRYDSGHVTETKRVHHVSPHTQPSIPMPGQADRTQRRYKCHRHQLRKRKNRESCVSPLTKAKLTCSCAGPNPGAITYTQFATDIALEETERCKRLALEHHKWHRMRTSEAQCRFSSKTSREAARDSREG